MNPKKDKLRKNPLQEGYSVSTVIDGENIKLSSEQFTERLEKIAKGTFDIRILKAKITKVEALDVEYKEILPDGTSNQVSKSCDAIVHPDLVKAFKKLVSHLVILCDQKETAEARVLARADRDVEDTDLPDYKIYGFSIGGNDEHEGVSISGAKNIEGKRLNLNSPFQKWDDEYKFSSELSLSIETCIHDVKEYLQGKAAMKQSSMDFPEDESTNS